MRNFYRHCEEAEGRRGKPEASREASGLLRFARNDGVKKS